MRLTAKGRALADRAIKLHFEALADELSGINHAERDQLATLLSKLLHSVEQRRKRAREAELRDRRRKVIVV